MCGRFAMYTLPSTMAWRYFGLDRRPGDDAPRYNVAPGTPIALFRAGEGAEPVELDFSWWGFRPHWAGDDAPAAINARAETVASSRYFHRAFSRHRGLVPADGWYEWRPTEAGKQPHFITRADGEPVWLAAIWTRAPEGEGTRCAIITQPAAENLRHVHSRMPMALDLDCAEAWLDPEATERDAIKAATRRLEPGLITDWPVSRRVNRPDNDDPGLLEAVDEG